MVVKNYNGKKNKKRDIKNKIIQNQADEIKMLQSEVSRLRDMCDKKDEIINSIEPLREELKSIIVDLNSKKNEYADKIIEIKKMKNVLDKNVFKGRWKLVKFLIK